MLLATLRLSRAEPLEALINCSVIPYQGNDAWVEDALRRAKQLVSEVDECPEHTADCEHGQYLAKVLEVVS